MFSTFLGGNKDDEGHGVAVDASGAIYLTGFTFSANFPTATPQQGALNGTATDAFVAKISPAGVTTPTAYDETYSYDTIGNLTSKAGATLTYGAQAGTCAGGATTRAHTVVNDGVRNLCYDANGSMLNDGIRTYVWDAENRPSSITTSATASVETYGYDGDGARVTKAVGGGATTTYLEGVWEASSTGAVKTYYAFGGQMIAVRDSTGVTYLHGDHLGSISVVTTSSGAVASRQQFDPWGQVRSGGISQTSMNYTGQRRDDTGLLFYNARYYDPALGRFISADTIVPGARALNFGVDPDIGSGPADPQDLNRYTYVGNNPINKADPTGHCTGGGFVKTAVSVLSGDCTRRAAEAYRHARTTQDRVITGAVAATSAVGAAAGWVGGALLAIAGGSAVATAVAGSSAATGATTAAGTVATAACADGDCSNEASATAERASIVAKFDWSRIGHVFREADGHVDPLTAASRERFARLFEQVASRSDNLRSDFPLPGGALKAGINVFTQTFRSGKQVWVYVRDGLIVNAGINPTGGGR